MNRAALWAEGIGWGRAKEEVDPRLYPFQAAGAARLRGIMEQWGCALLCDAVGLGKTHTAIAAAGDNAVAVVPAALRSKWAAVCRSMGVRWTILTHQQLSRRRYPPSGGVVVVDEAHHFRSPGIRRYQSLASLIGYQRVLFVTATPIWNSRRDLLALLALGLSQQSWVLLTGRRLAELAPGIDRDDEAFGALLDTLAVRRNAEVAGMFGGGLAPLGAKVSRTVEGAVAPDLVTRAVVSAARSSMGWGEPGTLFALSCARQLSSSTEAVGATLKRAQDYLEQAQIAQKLGRTLPRREFRQLHGQQVLPFWYPEGRGALEELAARIESVRSARGLLENYRMGESAKYQVLLRSLQGKVIIFTEFVATARELFSLVEQRSILMTGSRCELKGVPGVLGRRDALALFRGEHGGDAPTVLIATAVGSEGLDILADRVIHYDVPWNPARLQQRLGRARRLGSTGLVQEILFEPAGALEAEIRALQRLVEKEGLVGWGAAPELLAEWLRGGAPRGEPHEHVCMLEDGVARGFAQLGTGIALWQESRGWVSVSVPYLLRQEGRLSAGTGGVSLRVLLSARLRRHVLPPDLTLAMSLERCGLAEEAARAAEEAVVAGQLGVAAMVAREAGVPLADEHLQRYREQRGWLTLPGPWYPTPAHHG